MVLRFPSQTCFCAIILMFVYFPDTKAHSRDPKPTKLDPNDPKSKQTYIPPAESFEEYMKRRAAQGKK